MAIVLIAYAIGREPAEPRPPAPPAAVEVALGEQRVRFRAPAGWLHGDHGKEQLFENQLARISLADLGPATPEGFAATLREAQALFEQNQWEDAREILVAINPRRFFSNEALWESIRGDWTRVTRIRRTEGPGELGRIDSQVDWEVRAAFHDLLVRVSALPQPALETLAVGEISELGHDSLRDIASQQATAISGYPALRIVTWDRLSHQGRQSHLFVLSEGRLLCLRTGFGQVEVLEPAFESLAASLEIVRDQGMGGE